jgi:glycine hydroxymethyltransferase
MSKLIDSELQFLINAEQDRERNELEMIASENYVSKSVMAAMSNIFTNKYSE